MKRELLLVLGVICLLQSCTAQSQKINGVSFVASREPISQKNVMPVVKVNANYAAVMPFGFVRDLTHPEIRYNTQRQWLGETKSGAKQYAEELLKQNIKIMIKPQIWVSHGVFTGHIEMTTEENWQIFQNSYTKFILEYARLAQEIDADIFCIGTELERFITQRPEYWSGLIKDIKNIYKGELTYAANWDEFKRTPFWDKLDYIGIDAYFPVSQTKTPTVSECMANWTEHKAVIKDKSLEYKKPILFTEFGYRSVDYTGKEPWRSDREMNSINLEAQTNASKALFETFWKEDWFAGGFIWKWFHNHETAGGVDNSRFTPQNKPVERLIESHYGAYK